MKVPDLANVDDAGVHPWTGATAPLKAAAAHAQLRFCAVDLSKARDRATLFAELDRSLALPEHFGHNFDALADVLEDRDWLGKHGRTIAFAHATAYRKDHPDWPEELLRPMCESKKQLDTTVVDTMSKRLHLERTNWLATIGSIPHPMLVFTADPELGAIVTPQAAAKARELNPKVTLVHVPKVGHLIRFDNFPVFMNALQRFLKEV